MPPLTYCKGSGPTYVVSRSRSTELRKKPETETPTHKIAHALAQAGYESSLGTVGGFAAAYAGTSQMPCPVGTR